MGRHRTAAGDGSRLAARRGGRRRDEAGGLDLLELRTAQIPSFDDLALLVEEDQPDVAMPVAAAPAPPGASPVASPLLPLSRPDGLVGPGGACGFRAAAAALSADPRGDDARGHAEAAAAALLALALAGDEGALGDLLRVDPSSRAPRAWTVACYQLGDLSPSGLRDFASPVEALRTLAGCGDPGHLAAELLVSDESGVRWTALVRTGQAVAFQLPAGASTGEPSMREAALRRWEERLEAWAAGVDDTPTVEPGTGPAAVGTALGEVLEAVRRIEHRLPGDDHAGLSAEVARQGAELARLGGRLQELATGMGAVSGRLDGVDRRVAGTPSAADLQQVRADLSALRADLSALALRVGEFDRPARPPRRGWLGRRPARDGAQHFARPAATAIAVDRPRARAIPATSRSTRRCD